MTQLTWEGPIPTSGRQRRGVLAPVLGLIALGICGLVVLGLVASSVGVAGVIVGALCALVPVALVVATFLWIDRWEPEPPRLLLFAFLWGACFAALSALVINSSAALIADEVLGRGSGDVVGAVAVAPIVEEAVKGVFLVGLLIFRRREFDGIVDGIVYAGLVAAGFAFTENILYFGRAFSEDATAGTTGGVFALLVMRGVLSPFAHPLFTAMTGIAAGVASNSRNPVVRLIAVLIGYALAVTLHALWNASASLHEGEAFIGVYAFIMVPLFLAMIAIVFWQRRREQRIVIEQLPGFAQAGWIAPSEIALLSSLAGRRGWRAAVRRRSGKRVAKAVTDYQAAVTDLAFLRSRMARGSVGNETGMFWHGEALSELARSRDRAIGHPEALTMALRHHGPADWSPPPPGPPPPGPPPGVPQSYPAPPRPGVGPPPSWPSGPPIRPVTPPGTSGWPGPDAPPPGPHPGSVAPPGRPDLPPGPGRYLPPPTGTGAGPAATPGPARPGARPSPGSFSDQPTRRITVRRPGEPSADSPPSTPLPEQRPEPSADDDSPTTRR
jgi:RsiW-degrading membrane proteinase PrsW (M82 family)